MKRITLVALLLLPVLGYCQPQAKQTPTAASTNKAERKLRYLMATNAGLLGFFSDGSVAGCPRCDLMKSNVAKLKKMKPDKEYTAAKDHLLMDGERLDIYIDGEISQDWAMVDYKWISEPE